MSINQFKKTERNNVRSAEARRILSILADNPVNAIATDENGRPFFHDSGLAGASLMDFSISHSGAAVAVSLVISENTHGVKARTGCDIELIRPRKNLRNIAENNFSAAERDYIFSQNETQLESARFFQIWTLKECYIKLRGLSVFDMPKAPSFISNNASCSSSISFYLYELVHAGERYMLATCIEEDSIADQGRAISPEPVEACEPKLRLGQRILSSSPPPVIRLFSQPEGDFSAKLQECLSL